VLKPNRKLKHKEHTKKNIKQFIFKSNPFPMHWHFVMKQIKEAHNSKHRKVDQVQLQYFQHKEGGT
jgi:hypothetical protein